MSVFLCFSILWNSLALLSSILIELKESQPSPTRTCISCAYMVRYWMGKMLAGSIERLLDNDRMDMVSDEFLRVGNKVPRFVLPGCGQDSTSSAYWMRETFDRSFASTGTEPCESITSSIAGALGLFAGRSLTSYTKERSLSCRGDCGSEE